MFIAGEASGDTLAAELAKALAASPGGEHFSFFGAGGPRMAAAGVDLAFDLTEHAVVGIVEVLKNYGKFKRFFNQLLDLAAARKPDFIILVDYPGFNLRFAKALKERVRASAISTWNPKIVYYVSPQIWAWHESRIHQITRDIDLMLAIFPFEKAWYHARKPSFKVEFVGHPLIDRFAAENPAPAHSSAQTLLLLPGSRVRELRKHLPPMVDAARRARAGDSALNLSMVLPSESLKSLATGLVDLSGFHIQIGGLASALQSATVAIASSGTVTMECAYFRVPTVVIYKTSWSTYLLGRRFIKVKHLAMPNLLSDHLVYPEFIQQNATSENIHRAILELLRDEHRRTEIKKNLGDVIASLGEPGASTRAARAILDVRSSA